jgi:hypothetical protein
MKNKLYLTYVLALFLSMPIDATAATIRISNPRIELELDPGASYSGEIVAENPENEEVKTKIYAEDWMYAGGGTGEKKFMAPGSSPHSASKWISFAPAEATIPPFGRITLRYTIVVPNDVKGGYYSVLFFETNLGTTTNDDGVNVLVAGRIGALFLIQVKGTVERSGQIKSVKVEPPKGNKPLEITTEFQNTGNVDITLSGNLLILDSEGKVLGRGDLNSIYTFPGSTESGKTQWIGRLSKGSYELLLTYDLGKGKTEVKEETLNIS